MNCNDCKNEMVQLFDESADTSLTDTLKQHIAACPSCAAAYDEMKDVLTALHPKTTLSAPFLLKQNILEQLSKEKDMKSTTTKRVKLYPVLKRVLAVAAIVAAIMLILPFISKNNTSNSTAKAAVSVFESSIQANDLIKTMKISFSIRTDPKDNFALIGKDYDMVDHTILRSFENPEKWIISKSGRTVLFDGTNQYLWVPFVKMAVKGPGSANFAEWFKILLDPSTILLKEKEDANDKGSKLTMSEANGNLLITVTSKAQGNFLNDYAKNSSISESDNRREYVFDHKTKLLKGLKIYLLDKQVETLILNITNIEYDIPVAPSSFSITLPNDITWEELKTDLKNDNLSNISSKEAASLALQGLAKNDFEANKELWSEYNFFSKKLILSMYGGLQVIKIGEPFKSGLYPGEFVPYKIKLSDGGTKNFRLAIRNDNKNKVWMVDGGL
jgi:hypothetical protein